VPEELIIKMMMTKINRIKIKYSVSKLSLSLAFLMGVSSLFSQPFGNEWINYNQTYFKIKVTADGMYRIPFSTLNAAIPNLSTINPQNLAMYHNGQEVPIYVSTIFPFTTSDYIDFYGKKNIGDLDSAVYENDSYQPHPYFSLFSDTAVYFLTINNSNNNRRLNFIPNDLSAPLPQSEEFFWQTSKVFYLNQYFQGKSYFTGGTLLYKSTFDEGEGWGSRWINANSAPLSINLQAPSVYTASPMFSVLNVSISSRSNEQHNIVTSLNGNVVSTASHYGSKFFRVTHTSLNTTLLPANTVTIDETGSGISSQQNILHHAELSYPRKFEFDNASTFYFVMEASATKKKIDVSLHNSLNTQPLLYDFTNNFIVKSTDPASATTRTFVLPASASKREMFICADDASSYRTVDQMSMINFANYSQTEASYLIITNKRLMVDSNNVNWVEEYRRYRDQIDNPTSGKYIARIFDIDQLYDQFAYGVTKSPIAIRNLLAYGQANWGIRPEYLFLIGKAREYHLIRGNAGAYNQTTVPTWGFPGSDIMFANQKGSLRPVAAVGRLAAVNGEQVRDYLEKVKQYELEQNTFGDPYQTKINKEWMKQVMHFGGGGNTNEQNLFKSYLRGYENKIKDTLWGANVASYYKTSSAPVSTTVSQIIKGKIDSGVSLMTFFGHSSTSSFDLSVDEPENYTNYGKYPILLSNGCFAGFLHDASRGLSERFVLTKNKGMIGFIASANLSRSDALSVYSNTFYQNIAVTSYGKSLGKMLQQTVRDIDSLYSGNDFTTMVSLEMTLHGDPGIKMNQYDIPDYEIDQASVSYSPSTIDASQDSFEVNVLTTNLGKAIRDTSFSIKLRRTVYDANNQPVSFDHIIKTNAPYYKNISTLRLPTRIDVNLGYGQNDFSVLVESDLKTDELSETNNGNIINFGSYVQSDDILPIYPYDFSIVPKQNVTLKASTVNPFAPYRKYIFQIDTTELFNSFLMKKVAVSQIGGVVRWKTNLTMFDSTVYYWRVSRDSISPTQGYNWHYSSFLYLKDEYPGWNQSHYYQYKKDQYPDYLYIDNDRQFKFNENVNEIKVVTGWADAVGGPLPFTNLSWELNNVPQYRFRMGGCGFLNGITFGVVDGSTNQPWISINQGGNWGQFGNYHCATHAGPQPGFDFAITGFHPTLGIPWSKVVENFLDSIPAGAYIVMYSTNRPNWTSMDQSLVNRLTSMGALSLPNFKNGTLAVPYTFFTQKGNTMVSEEAVGVNYLTTLFKTYQFTGRWNEGTMKSTLIGPAYEWGSMHWRHFPMEQNSTDEKYVEVYGVTNNGQENLLFNTTALDTALNFVDAVQYPYLKLKYNAKDDQGRTPAQLKYWRVLFKTVPEAAINPAAHFKISGDSLTLGDSLNIEIAFENVTEVRMDSVLTDYSLQSITNGAQQDYLIRDDSLPGLDTLILKFKQPIMSSIYDGTNKLVIEANPDNDQPEQFHFNNFAIINFSARPDKINPLLDVTFDGRHIMNGDIVSAKPNIMITLKDENKSLALNDSSLVSVFLKYPGQTNPVPYVYDNSTLTFYPATGDISKNNRAKAEFKPQLQDDGVYELLIKDKDRTGNNSSTTDNRYLGNAAFDYRIAFEVVNKPMISNVLNYPNPFSTATKFVFTITGSEVPSYMKIQIMTITGKVVKEITKDELGQIYVGTNISQYTWDGRDEFGDLLANGVYFYRVISNLNGKQMDRLESNSRYMQNSNFDKYFKQGFGKLVILR
jgi:hypothetical protein